MPSTYVFGPVCNDLTVMAGTSLTLTAGFDLNVLGDVDIQGTLVVNNSSSLVSVAGDWTNDGAFSHGLGEVDLTGSGALEGTTPTLFNNLTISGIIQETAPWTYLSFNPFKLATWPSLIPTDLP